MEPTAPCPICKAENLAHRRECWRCKKTLPKSFALDADLGAKAQLASEAKPPTKQDIERCLREAIIVSDPELERESSPFPYAGGAVGKRLIWMFRRRTHPG
jgi:hypothetical protein